MATPNQRKRGKQLYMPPAEKRLYRSSRTNSENHLEALREDGDAATTSAEELTHLLALLQPVAPAPSTEPSLLLDLPEEVLYRITSFLTARELLHLRSVNRFYNELAARNEAGWGALCRRLWKDKVHVCTEARALAAKNEGMQAYRVSTWDAVSRNHMRLEELLYDPQTQSGTVWSFRFKESAGQDWTNLDPWYQGRPARKIVFLADGTCQPYVPPKRQRQPQHRRLRENNRYQTQQQYQQQGALHGSSVVSVSSGGSSNNGRSNGSSSSQQEDEHHQNDNSDFGFPRAGEIRDGEQGNNVVVEPPAGVVGDAVDEHGATSSTNLTTSNMLWRLITRPMDLPTRQIGSYIRITVGGRDVPTYSVQRSPANNWGFIMESCWGLFASFELPPRKTPVGTGAHEFARPPAVPPTVPALRRRLRRTSSGNTRWVWAEPEEDEQYGTASARRRREDNTTGDAGNDTHDRRPHESLQGAENTTTRSDPWDVLRDDTHLTVTNDLQWREAFLYNVGARVLPEGDEATGEFDRAWGGLGV